MFDAGTALHSFEKGIKPGLILTDRSQQQIAREYRDIFAYDFKAEKNTEDLSYFKPCQLTHGGCCKDDLLVDRASILTKNVYRKARERKGVFPVILEFGLGDWNGFVVLGRFIGKGELAFVQRACIRA